MSLSHGKRIILSNFPHGYWLEPSCPRSHHRKYHRHKRGKQGFYHRKSLLWWRQGYAEEYRIHKSIHKNPQVKREIFLPFFHHTSWCAPWVSERDKYLDIFVPFPQQACRKQTLFVVWSSFPCYHHWDIVSCQSHCVPSVTSPSRFLS